MSGSVATEKNGVVDDAIKPGDAARSIGAALQQQPLDITAVSHDVADGAQQLCVAMALDSTRAAQLAEFGNAAKINTNAATSRNTRLILHFIFRSRAAFCKDLSSNNHVRSNKYSIPLFKN
ncbi:MAG: hypothetical protein JST89_22100 [Cyanobacteria bacterium SZAS-4]|nr:hypothetical protein [Cyanobacteria bacterium SZAS-4]